MWATKPLVGNITLNDNVAIVIPAIAFINHYDADSQLIEIKFDMSIDVSAQDKDTPFVILSSDKKTLKSARGQTAMGVRFIYERKAFLEFCAKLSGAQVYRAKMQFQIAPDIARLNSLWLIAFIGKLSEPYYFNEQSFHEPTLSEPYAQLVNSSGIVLSDTTAWVFNPIDGKVLAKVRLP